MIRFFSFFLFASSLLLHPSFGWSHSPSPTLPLDSFQNNDGEILVENRILAIVNGKPISVIDVMKKMEVILAHSQPEYADATSYRFQFFSQNWKQTLSDLIDNELIIADAEKLQIKIADAEVREKIHERFGPNVVETLDSLGLTFEEAWHMIYSEIAVQRISGFRVYAKAFNRIGPQDIKQAYTHHLVENPPKEEWVYRVLSIRTTTEALGKVFAQKAQALISGNPLPFEKLAAVLEEEYKKDPSVTFSLSEPYKMEGSRLSDSHHAVLCNLEKGNYSQPLSQISRRNGQSVHRIFYLEDHIIESTPSLNDLYDTLQDDLVYGEISKEFPPYLAKLRKQFNFDESTLDELPSNFQPFSLR